MNVYDRESGKSSTRQRKHAIPAKIEPRSRRTRTLPNTTKLQHIQGLADGLMPKLETQTC